MSERALVPNVPPAEASRVFTKLNKLNEKQEAAGYYELLEEGGSVSGVLMAIGQDKFEKVTYDIERADGKIQVVTGQGNLNNQMKGIEPGTYVQITYKGLNTMKTGKYAGKEAHGFSVLKEQI